MKTEFDSMRCVLILLTIAQLIACGGGADDVSVAAPSCDPTPSPVKWTQEIGTGPWRARDSAAELIFNGRMWLMGGWFDSYQPTPQDVWSSADGLSWQLVAAPAPWTHGDLAAAVNHQGRMWLLGGWGGGRLPGASASNEVWASADGANWQYVTRAAWSPRVGAAAVEFKNRIWVLGGVDNYYYGDATSLHNDVWSSSDGVNWAEELHHAPWRARAYHGAFVFDNKLWVVGGGNYTPGYLALNDVWSSDDGINWHEETSAAPWAARIWFSTAVYRGYMWVIGGWSNDPYTNWGDTWYSRDGRTWTRLQSTTNWQARHEHSTYVFDDRLWVVGGFAAPLTNDAWSLQLPADWVGGCPLAAKQGNHGTHSRVHS